MSEDAVAPPWIWSFPRDGDRLSVAATWMRVKVWGSGVSRTARGFPPEQAIALIVQGFGVLA